MSSLYGGWGGDVVGCFVVIILVHELTIEILYILEIDAVYEFVAERRYCLFTNQPGFSRPSALWAVQPHDYVCGMCVQEQSMVYLLLLFGWYSFRSNNSRSVAARSS